jgi:hypothetical protein
VGISPSTYFKWPDQILSLLLKWNVKSFFDSGCRNRDWIRHNKFAENGIIYTGGDISKSMVEFCNSTFPQLEILHHDATTDPFPDVDLIFSSDVLIHLNNVDKLRFLQNFRNSKAKYLLMTNHLNDTANTDFEYTKYMFPFANIYWLSSPWNFPTELDSIDDCPNDKRLRLWSKEQLATIIDNLTL